MKRSTASKKKLKARTTFTFEATGTTWLISSPEVNKAAKKQVREIAEQFENIFSRFKPDSLVQKIAKQAGEYQFPDYSEPLFAAYEALEAVTHGSFTPLIGASLVDAGYDSTYSFKDTTLKENKRLSEVLKIKGSTITTHEPLQLDFGAGGKGLLVDLVAKVLTSSNVQHFTINAGGDIYTTEKVKIGMEHPTMPGKLIGEIEIASGAVCASSSNRRNWGKYHHIIDGKKLESPSDIIATWVFADTAMMADLLATCLFLTTPEKLQQFSFKHATIYSDGRSRMSTAFPGTFYENN